MIKKIAVIGTGYVGSSIAYSLMLTRSAENIALIDINETAVTAEVADIRPGLAAISSVNVYAGSYADTADSDVIVVTAGVNRKPGETRMDLIGKNAVIAKNITDELKKNNARGVIVVVSNPVDVITHIIAREMNETSGRVFGTGCLLDTARFCSVLGDFLGVPEQKINAFVIGEHGAGQILLWSSVTVDGVPLKQWLSANGKTVTDDDKAVIAKRIADMGAFIIKGKGRTHYGIAACATRIVDALSRKETTLLPLSRPLNGDVGCDGVSLSLPCLVNENGIARAVTDGFGESEVSQFQTLAANMKKTTESWA